MFPTYLLNKIYVPKSLKNTDSGFAFTLKNVIDSGTLGGVKSMIVDGEMVALDAAIIETSAGTRRLSEISPRSSVTLRVNAEFSIYVTGQPLDPGSHKIILNLYTMEAGTLGLTIEDVVE